MIPVSELWRHHYTGTITHTDTVRSLRYPKQVHWVGEIFVFELFVMPRYRGNREYRGVRSTPPPRQIATPPATPALHGGWWGEDWVVPPEPTSNWGNDDGHVSTSVVIDLIQEHKKDREELEEKLREAEKKGRVG